MRFYKIKALFKLGLEDLLKNMNVFIYIILPLGFALLYSQMEVMPKGYLFSMCILLNLSMVPVALMGTIIAEEKEKNTLRTLILNDVKATEILLSKALICMSFVLINNILIYFIASLPISTFVLYQLVAIFVSCAVIFLGAVVGLFSKNQMSAGLLSMPFMLILMAPMFIQMVENKAIGNIVRVLPTDAMMEIFSHISDSSMNFSNVGVPFLIIAIWFVGSIVLFNIAYKKVGVDN
ncbi:MAG: ABC transporter permease [Lachnospiraceae bacterium]|nr:ABC transporter permease [Lachnospiraceae bacterium]